MNKRPGRKDHLFDARTIVSGLFSKHANADAYIQKKMQVIDKVVRLLSHFKELPDPTFLDFQLIQLIADASHFISTEIGKRVILPEQPEAVAICGVDDNDEKKVPDVPIRHDGGPNQFSQPGCEVACTVISLIFALLYLEDAYILFEDLVKTINWNTVMRQSKFGFRAWRRMCEDKLHSGKIRNLPSYPTVDEIWYMPEFKTIVAPYVTIDKTGYYKTKWMEDGKESTECIPFKERLKRVDAVTKRLKVSLAHVITSISLTICILSIYKPATGHVRYVIYDPHGTFLMERERQEAHYALNFRNDAVDKKAFLVEYPSIECLFDNAATIPFFALQEAQTEPTKYTFATVARVTFEY